MATFTGQLISATYDAILKTIDNDAIGASAKQITDGLGNSTPLYISSTQIGIGITPTEALHVSGNAIITGSITIDTNATVLGTISGVLADGVTATTQTAGDNSTKVATTAYVSTALEGQDTLEEVLAIGNTTGGTNIAVSVGDNITFGSTSKAIYFNSLEIYATGNDAYLKSLNGSLSLINNDNGTEKTVIKVNSNTAELYNNNVKKLQTTSTGINVIGDATFAENDKALFGNNADLEIYRDANDSRIVDEDSIIIKSQHIAFQAGTSTETIAHFYGDSSVELYYDGVKKFSTTSAGIDVTGDLTVGTDSLFVDVSTDSVGIGLTNPSAYSADTLVINTPDEKGITLVSSSTEKAYLAFQDGTGALENFMSFDHAVKKMNFNVFDTGGDINFTIGEGVTKFNIDNTNVRVYDDLTVDGNSTFTGDVGIGITPSGYDTNADNLVVGSTGVNDKNGITIVGGDTDGRSAIYFADTTQNSAGYITYFHSNNSMLIGTSDSTALTIDGSRNSTFAGIIRTTVADSDTVYADASGNGTVYQYTNGTYTGFRQGTDKSFNIDTFNNSSYTNVLKIRQNGTTTFAGNVAINGGVVTLGIADTSSGHINAYENMTFNIDIDNDDTTRYFGFYKNGSDGSGTELLKIEESGNSTFAGNVGIGVSTVNNPFTAQAALQVGDTSTTTNNGLITIGSGTAGSGDIYFADGTSGGSAYRGFVSYKHNGDYLAFGTAETTRMIIDSSGRIGIGITPKAWTLFTPIQIGQASSFSGRISSNQTDVSTNWYYNGAQKRITAGFAQRYTQHSNGDHTWMSAPTDAADSTITWTEHMRITSGGNVQIKDNPTSSPYEGMIVENLSNGCRLNIGRSTSAIVLGFYNNNGLVGSISTSGSSTVYSTNSDYRLKEDLQDFAGLDMVSKIPVYDFKWKTDESRSYGVMAHELQEVLPDAVVGEKDAEEMQGVDYSKIVPLLVKSIQEQQVMLKELKAEVDKLKQECKCK